MADGIKKILFSRMTLLAAVLLAMFAIVLLRFYHLQVDQGESYQQQLEDNLTREQTTPGFRGTIYDRNGEVLAYNELIYKVTITDSGIYEESGDHNQGLNRILDQVIEILEGNGDSIQASLPIREEAGNLVYSAEGQELQRFLADVYGHASAEGLGMNQRLGYDESQASAEQVLDYLRSDSRFGIGEEYSQERAMEIAALRLEIGANSYRRYVATDVAEEISQESMAAILEAQVQLTGVDVVQESRRRYVDSEYFAHILGYTGTISQEELDAYEEQGLEYDRNAQVGKAGIEQALEQSLRGDDGRETFYVDSLGRVTQVLETREASVGQDVYLTIDAQLQKTIYDLLEQKLAGIILANMTPEGGEASELAISESDVVMALLENHVADGRLFGSQGRGTAQRQLYESLQERIQGNEGILRNSFSVPYGQLSQELQDIQDLMRALLEEEGYLEGALPQETSQWWAEGSASLEEFLQRGIEEQWLSPMESQERYTSGGQAVEQLEQWILERLPEDEDYQFLLWRQMLAEGRISGEQVCMALLEQGKVADENGAYEQLSSGSLSAYAFLREKIRNLELTPAQLALDPSTASCVVVEPDTGQVLACVTYPGYDNNRLANQVDGDYYNQLLEDRSLPLYNNALQQETAPGSTFKPITAAAALTEGLIGPDTVIETHGIFEEITPSPRCWIYPGGTHGAINVAEAIRDSCNYFFYTLGYDMSLEGETYVPAKGIETLRHYVELFGLNERTGLEIGESEPQMADEFPVTAAIGQSNHNYTTAQLARYTAVLANGGNLYDLTLVDHLEDPDTGESQRREPLLRRSLEEISDSTWQVIDQGMTMMAESNDVLSQLGISVAGKTGTAQQNQNRPNHALFVGYGPAEEPQIAVATRIACGYSSANALEVTADIFRYYFGLSPREELVTGQADIPEGRGNVRAD